MCINTRIIFQFRLFVCFMQMREQKNKTELTVNDNPGSVLHQDPIERIEEDASSTYFIDKEGTILSAGSKTILSLLSRSYTI